MAEDYPYVLNNGKIGTVFDKIATAAKPERFSYDFLEKLGFTSTNDRAFVSLLRRLGFLTESNQPNSYYDDLRDKIRRPIVIATKIKELYRELYAIDESIHKASDAELKAAISRVTGKDEQTVNRVFNTFKGLISQANFETSLPTPPLEIVGGKPTDAGREHSPILLDDTKKLRRRSEPEFHYNIQIVLPATTEVAVYNAIFKSLRENLDI